MTFEAFRKNGGPTYYEEVKTPFEADLLTSGLIFSFVILAVSFYLILPGVQGKDKLFTFIRITTSLFIGAVILVSNFSMTWDVAEVHTRTKYKAGIGNDVNVTVGVNIGFRGVNITLKGDGEQIKGETIDYNENFNWEGLQGRLGFGPFAGTFNQEYRAAQFRGLPLPILWIAEYFTLDGEGARWGRHYRQAGWYSHIMLWLAFPLWVLANILFFVLLRYGAYFLIMTGLSMLTSNIIWATLRNPVDLIIPFTAHEMLDFTYGGSFWICLITGVICIVLGIVIFLLDKLVPTQIAIFFGVDVLQDSENILVEEDDEAVRRKPSDDGTTTDGNGAAAGAEDDDDEELYLPPPPAETAPGVPDRARPYVMKPQLSHRRTYRTAEHRITKKLQRPRRRDPPPVPPKQQQGEDEDSDDGDYQNAPPIRQPPHNIGNRQSLHEDDLYENSNAVPMVRFQPK